MDVAARRARVELAELQNEEKPENTSLGRQRHFFFLAPVSSRDTVSGSTDDLRSL